VKVAFGFVAAAGEARLRDDPVPCVRAMCRRSEFSFVRQHFVPDRFSTAELLLPARSKYFES
jgi:hypothetical protein